MNRSDQKEFLTPLLNISNSLNSSADKFTVKKVQSDIFNTMYKGFTGESYTGSPPELTYEDLEAQADDLGVEPIDIFEFMCNTIAENVKDIDLYGKTVSFDHVKKIFQEAKENFIKQKESEDIRNY